MDDNSHTVWATTIASKRKEKRGEKEKRKPNKERNETMSPEHFYINEYRKKKLTKDYDMEFVGSKLALKTPNIMLYSQLCGEGRLQSRRNFLLFLRTHF